MSNVPSTCTTVRARVVKKKPVSRHTGLYQFAQPLPYRMDSPSVRSTHFVLAVFSEHLDGIGCDVRSLQQQAAEQP